MKKLSLLALPLALLALGSCDNNELQNNKKSNEIGVVSVNGIKSNRGYTEGNDFYETLTDKLHGTEAERNTVSRTMSISGYLTLPDGTAKNYFQAATFKEYNDTRVWHNYNGDNPDPIYWPLGGKMDFLAYSISSEGPEPQSVEWSEKTAEKVVLGLANGCSQNDILYAGAYGITASQDAGNVNMKFQHAQAWIEFVLTGDAKDYAGNEVADAIHFESIELENIFSSGTLTIKQNGNAAMADWSFDNGYSRRNVPMDGCESIEYLNSTPQYLDMLIPYQAQTKFLLKYSFKNRPGNILEYEFDLSGKGDYWNMGEKYVYTIHLNANEITVTPTVEPWGENKYTTLNRVVSMKAIGGATEGKLLVNGEEYDPMRLYKENEVLEIVAKTNGSDKFRWEDSTTIKNDTLKMTAKEFNEMENPMKVLFYTDKVIPFAYSVSPTKKVYFASGNLYATATATDTTFAFEAEQYYFRTRPNNTAKLADGVVTPVNTSGLFQWDVTKAVEGGDFGAFGKKESITATEDDVLDFGQAMGDNWAALSNANMTELLNSRIIGWSTVNLVNGFILKPDSFIESSIPTGYDWNTNPSGLVFLPAAGCFYDGSVNYVGDCGGYWSSSSNGMDFAFNLYFYDGSSNVDCYQCNYGFSVRLVWRAE